MDERVTGRLFMTALGDSCPSSVSGQWIPPCGFSVCPLHSGHWIVGTWVGATISRNEVPASDHLQGHLGLSLGSDRSPDVVSDIGHSTGKGNASVCPAPTQRLLSFQQPLSWGRPSIAGRHD